MAENETRDVSAESLDLAEYHAGWLYEQVHRPPRRSIFTSFGFWLVFSIVLHGMLFAALSPVIFGNVERRPQKRTIEVETDMVELRREDQVTYRSTIDMEEKPSTDDTATRLKESLSMGVDDVDLMGVDDMAINDSELAMLDETSRPRVTRSSLTDGADLTRKVDTGGRDMNSQMNIVSRKVLEGARRRPVTAVILFDESQSLLRERAIMGKQLDRIFEELNFSMSDALEKRVQWAVVSFSGQPRLQINPTRDMAKVQQALNNMPVDQTGQESVCKAVKWCAEKFGGAGHSTMIIVVTDEQGDDIGIMEDDSRAERDNLRETVKICQERKTSIFVLGREAYLSHERVWAQIENIGGNWLERGLPTKNRETLGRIWHLNVNNPDVPSGFGCYSLSLLAYHTGGQFLIIDDKPSIYDGAIMAGFEPERLFPNDYDNAVKNDRWRRAVVEAVTEAHAGLPGHDNACERNLRAQLNRWRETRQNIADKVRWCDQTTDDLLKLGDRDQRDLEKDYRKRWEANRDLAVAQIYELKAILLQVDAEIEDALKMLAYPMAWPDNDKEGIFWRLNVARQDDKEARFHDGRDQRNALRDARNALEKVAREYNNTPWGRRAQLELDRLRPMKLYFVIDKYERDGGDRPHL